MDPGEDLEILIRCCIMLMITKFNMMMMRALVLRELDVIHASSKIIMVKPILSLLNCA